jgi:8-oxo-dGTP pyrophosphatase MutT (NUDIX family)
MPDIVESSAALLAYNGRMHWRPDITVAAVISREQRFLIVEERINARTVLNQPAGHVESGESLLAAVTRETREESGWQFSAESLVGVYLWRHPRSGRDTLRFAFAGQLGDCDKDARLDEPVIATHWLTHAELKAREHDLRTPVVMRCIDDFLAGQRLPLTAITEFSPTP